MIIPPAHDDGERPMAPSGWGAVTLLVGIGVALLVSSLLNVSLHRSSQRFKPIPAARRTIQLSAETRARLRPRMQRHARAMTALTDAVMSFDDQRVIRAATTVLDDPEATELPPTFHDFESALQANAEELLAAARTHDGDRLTAADADLAWTCAQCHAAFAGP